MEFKYKDITHDIIGSAFEVYNELGYGFLEKVYQRALAEELQIRNRVVELEHHLRVRYKGILVGEYYADLLVDQKVIVELKVAKRLNNKDESQLLNQLKATDIQVGVLINFGKIEVEYKRMVV